MESNSDLSSYSSQRIQANGIPSIHIQQYILQQHAKSILSIHQSQKKNDYPHIFTVAQTLKDPLILNHIKPDYGSLGQFIGDINIGRDLLNQKKRKNQLNEEEIQQKKLRSVLQKKTQQQLNSLYLSKSSSAATKRIAGKLLVQNLFKDSFGVTLNTFQTQNVKPQPVKNCKINLDRIQQIFSGKQSLVAKMQSNIDKKTLKAGSKNVEESKLQKNKRKQIRNMNERQKITLITEIKSKYPSIKRLQIKKQCQQYKKLKPKQQQQDQQQIQSKRGQQINQNNKPNHTLQISEKQLTIEKLSIKPELLLYILSQFQISKIQTIVLNQIRITQEQLCFMLEVIKNVCEGLNKLVIRCISLQKTQNFATKIKQLLEVSMLKQVTLQYLDIQTKQFCLICLGIGSNMSLEYITFDNNGIDERSCKSLQLVTKHCSNLKKISLKKNYLQPHHFSYFSAECKSKIVI